MFATAAIIFAVIVVIVQARIELVKHKNRVLTADKKRLALAIAREQRAAGIRARVRVNL